MAASRRRLRAVPFRSIIFGAVLFISIMLFSSVVAKAQATPGSSDTPGSVITLPAGISLPLVLTHPVDSKTTHRGDQLYAQITSPVVAGNQVAIPAGTFVQGVFDKLAREGARGEFSMRSVSLLFPNGYVANIAGPVKIESDEGTAYRNPSGGAKTGAILAPMIGLGLGTAIGAAAHTTETNTFAGMTTTSPSVKGVAIGSAVGLGTGAVVSVFLLFHSRQFYVDVGSPMSTSLPHALTLDSARVADSLKSQSQPVIVPIAPRPVVIPVSIPDDQGTCYTPEIPGTPPTVIPGTPPTGDAPGTPDIVIPGTPSTPGSPYPCPR